MRKTLKIVEIGLAVFFVVSASVLVIFADNTLAKEEEIMSGLEGAVNPYMAIAAACIAAIVGIIIFIKRKDI